MGKKVRRVRDEHGSSTGQAVTEEDALDTWATSRQIACRNSGSGVLERHITSPNLPRRGEQHCGSRMWLSMNAVDVTL